MVFMEIFGTSTPVKAMDLTFSECLDNSDVVALVGEPVSHFGQNAGRGRHGQSQGKPTHKTFTKEFEGQEVTVRRLAHPKPAGPFRRDPRRICEEAMLTPTTRGAGGAGDVLPARQPERGHRQGRGPPPRALYPLRPRLPLLS